LKQARQRASRRFLKDGARSSLPQYLQISFSALDPARDDRGEAFAVVTARAAFGLAPTARFFTGATDLWLGSGAPGYSSEAYPFPKMHVYLRQIYDAFGPHRMFWGTDITKMPCSWRQCLTMFTEELPWLSEDDKRLVMGEALCAWWGWDRGD
jgi:hypothetical protein